MTTDRFRVILLITPAAASGERTVLHVAAGKGDIEHVKRLLDSGVDVEARDRFGMTALHDAVGEGKADMVTVLLKGRADMGPRIN